MCHISLPAKIWQHPCHDHDLSMKVKINNDVSIQIWLCDWKVYISTGKFFFQKKVSNLHGWKTKFENISPVSLDTQRKKRKATWKILQFFLLSWSLRHPHDFWGPDSWCFSTYSWNYSDKNTFPFLIGVCEDAFVFLRQNICALYYSFEKYNRQNQGNALALMHDFMLNAYTVNLHTIHEQST